jgi:hypothetical protein
LAAILAAATEGGGEGVGGGPTDSTILLITDVLVAYMDGVPPLPPLQLPMDQKYDSVIAVLWTELAVFFAKGYRSSTQQKKEKVVSVLRTCRDLSALFLKS